VDDFGCARSILRKGPILILMSRAIRSPKTPLALVLLNATLESAEDALGGLYPLIHKDNRGSGALAPSIHIPGFGTVSIPPNLHIIIGLSGSTDAALLESNDLTDMFGVVPL
jgi:hypothetical protein